MEGGEEGKGRRRGGGDEKIIRSLNACLRDHFAAAGIQKGEGSNPPNCLISHLERGKGGNIRER